MREALFNMLEARLDFDGMAVLDLFAGSGALGLEALSRGAASAVFVESDARAAAVIDGNISTLGLPGGSLRRGTAGSLLGVDAPMAVDLVFADPPYDVPASEVDALLADLTTHGWAGRGTVVVVERPNSGPRLRWPAGWELWKERRYGDTRLEIAEYAG
ncbi:hypothetical protein MBRU_18740 [Mycolicibacterium brumae DSM 44177]|nr:hypothetical protein MBRU_18740 [Mycolicibacterium brumae DSM 44177]